MAECSMHDLRDWLACVEQVEELQTVRGADWNLEIGGISELNYRRKPSAALVFDDIKDYPKGFRDLTGSLTSARRVGLTLRLGTEMDDARLVEALRGKPLEWEAHARDFEPNEVENAPIFQNIVNREDVDLLKF